MLEGAHVIDVNETLRLLDKHATEFNFPVLDNANLALADARLTTLRSEENWCMLFEIVGYSFQESEFVRDVYAYGNCGYPEGLQGEEIVLISSPDEPLFDPVTGDCIADWRKWKVSIKGKEYSFSPSIPEYAEAQVDISASPGPGSIREIDILRFLVHKLNHPFFAEEKELRSLVPGCKDAMKFIQTLEWHHPDIAGDELPSHCDSIRSLLHAIANNNPKQFHPGRPNTHWKYWDQEEALNDEA